MNYKEVNVLKNEGFIRLRKQLSFSQSSLTEKMHVPVTTIRNWEYKRSTPSVFDMKKLAEILSVDENIIISIFEPEKTKVEQEKELESEMYGLLIQLFWGCNSIERFARFLSLFTYSKKTGTVCYNDYVFPFNVIFTDCNDYAVVFKDASDNYVVLTIANVINIKPVSMHFDIFTFEVVMNCPVFPSDVDFVSNSFRQRIRISVFNR